VTGPTGAARNATIEVAREHAHNRRSSFPLSLDVVIESSIPEASVKAVADHRPMQAGIASSRSSGSECVRSILPMAYSCVSVRNALTFVNDEKTFR